MPVAPRTVLLGLALLVPRPLPAAPSEPVQEGREARLAVQDRLGRPVAAATVCLLPACEAPLPARRDGDRVVATLAEAKGPVALRVSAPGFAPAEVAISPGPVAPRDVVLRASGAVRASLVASEGKQPVELTVSLREPLDPRAGSRGRSLGERKLTLPPQPETGKVAFDDVPAGTYVLSWEGPAVAAAQAPVRVAAVAVEAGPLAVRPGIALEGSVHDEAGAVVAGVEIHLMPAQGRGQLGSGTSRRATSGPGGAFVLTGVPVGEPMAWSAQAEGFQRAAGRWGGEARLEVVLRPAQQVTGRLVDEDGRPVPDQRLDLTYVQDDRATKRTTSMRGHAGSVASRADGRFSFFRQEPDRVVLRISRKGYRPKETSLERSPATDAPREVDLGDVVLERGRALRGQVVDAKDGAPLRGASVTARWQAQAGSDLVAATSDEDGTYELAGLPPGQPVRVTAALAGYAPATAESAAEAASLTLSLGHGGRIEGLVCGQPGELSRSSIWYGRSPEGASSARALEVDAQGRFVLENAEPGSYRLLRSWIRRDPANPMSFAGMSGHVSAEATVVEGQTASVRLACDGLVVSGTVIRDGQPVRDQRLVLAVGKRTVTDGFLDAEGRFSLRVPGPGRYDVWGEGFPPGKQAAAGGCDVPPGGLEGCLVDLSAVPAR